MLPLVMTCYPLLKLRALAQYCSKRRQNVREHRMTDHGVEAAHSPALMLMRLAVTAVQRRRPVSVGEPHPGNVCYLLCAPI
jgi:hypothetical protein